MAQLRCKDTSELLHEGTPLECAAIAEALGRDEVLFDDVGYLADPGQEPDAPATGEDTFDPEELLAGHRQEIDHLDGIAGDKETTKDSRDAAKARAAQLRGHLEPDAKTVKRARTKMDAARKRVKAARG